MNTETLAEVESKPSYEETAIEVDSAAAEFPCENKIGFTALCASCYLVTLLGDCPKNIRENATSPEEPSIDSQETLFAAEPFIFSLDTDSLVNESAVTAPASDGPSIRPVVVEAPRQEQPIAKEIVVAAEPERTSARSYRDLLFDDAVEVVIATPKIKQENVTPKPLFTDTPQREVTPAPVYNEVPREIQVNPISEAEITPGPLATSEIFTEPTPPAQVQPSPEAQIIAEPEAVEIVAVLDEPEYKQEPTPPQQPKATTPAASVEPLPVYKLTVASKVSVAEPPTNSLGGVVVTSPEPEQGVAVEEVEVPERTFTRVLLPDEEIIFEPKTLLQEEAIVDEAKAEEQEVQLQAAGVYIPQRPEEVFIGDEYDDRPSLQDSPAEPNDVIDAQSALPLHTPERLSPAIQKFSGVSFRYARSFIGAFALLTLVLVDR